MPVKGEERQNMAKIAKVYLKSLTPYSQGKHVTVEKLPKELANAYEERTWRERMHTNKNGNVFIPPMAFSNAIKEAAKYLSLPIPGKGKSLFTKHFEAGVLVVDPLILDIKKDEVEGEWVFVPSDGRRGGTTRVEKCFPFIPEWEGEITVHILDDIITEDVFKHVLQAAGSLIGVGRFRPRNWGYYGRFEIKRIEWSEVDYGTL